MGGEKRLVESPLFVAKSQQSVPDVDILKAETSMDCRAEAEKAGFVMEWDSSKHFFPVVLELLGRLVGCGSVS